MGTLGSVRGAPGNRRPYRDRFSKPRIAENCPPTTCATRKLMLIPAPAIARDMAWPRPGLLSPAASRDGMGEAEGGQRPG